MAEEHVGRKRRKEVRQAINLDKESKRLLSFIAIAIVVACILIIGLLCFSLLQAGQMKRLAGIASSVIILLIAVILVVPKSRRYFEVREDLEDHCRRFNISKDDMLAGK